MARPPGAGPPADFLRLRDVTGKRDIATLTLNNPGRLEMGPNSWARASFRAEAIPLALLDAMQKMQRASSASMTILQSALQPPAGAGRAGGAGTPAPMSEAELKALMDKATQDAIKNQQELLNALPASDKVPVTTSGALPYIADAAFSADGRRVAAWAWPNEIGVWDTASGRQLATLRGHADGISSVVFSPDNTRLYSASFDGTLRVWDLNTSTSLVTINAHAQAIQSLALTRDGTRLVTGGADGAVRMWDTATHKPLWSRLDAGKTRTVAISPDGRRVASGGDDTSVRVWDAATGLGLGQFYGHTQPVNTVAFSPDGNTIASGGIDRSIRVWNPGTGGIGVTGLHDKSLINTILGWRGDSIVTSTSDRTIFSWDALKGTARSFPAPEAASTNRAPATGTIEAALASMNLFTGTAAVAGISRNGQRVVYGAATGIADVWDVATGKRERSLQGSARVHAVIVSDDARRGYISTADGKMRAWNLDTGELIATADSVLAQGVISRDGRWIAQAEGAPGVVIRDTQTLQPVRTFGVQGRTVRAIALSPDAKEILIVSSDLATMSEVTWSTREVATGRSIRTASAPPVFAVTYSPDGLRIAGSVSSIGSESIRLWDAKTLETLLTMTDDELVHARDEPAVKKLPPGSASDPMQRLASLNPQSPPPTADALAFSPDGRRLASIWTDGSLRVFDATPKSAWQQARDIVNSLNVTLPFVIDVIDYLNSDTTLAADVRDFAITFERQRTGTAASPASLNSASWRVAKSPGENPADYRIALRRVQEAVKLDAGAGASTRANDFNTLAMVHYRLGQYSGATAAVSQAATLRPGNPNDQVVSVLIRLKTGQLAAARADLDKLLALKPPAGDLRNLIDEARALSESLKPKR